MPSATLAESRLSIPPSRVKDSAAGSTWSTRCSDTVGALGIGRPCGMAPNRLATVSTGRWSSTAAIEAAVTAISMPGQVGR